MSTSNSSASIRLRVAQVLAAMALTVALPAHAALFCVNTSAELRTALSTAAGNNADDVIRIARGTYNTGGNEFYYSSLEPHSLDIQGGYSADCSSRIRNAANTVLDGEDMSTVLAADSPNGAFGIRFVTIQHGLASGNVTTGGGLNISGGSTVDADVAVSFCVIRQNSASAFGGGLHLGNSNSVIRVENNVFAANDAGITNGGAEIVGNGTHVYFINNTVIGNTVGDANSTGGIRIGGSAPADISNNILWNNSNFDLSFGTAVLVDNDYGKLYQLEPPGSSGNLSVAPLIVGAGNFHLRATSPLLDKGTKTPVGGLPGVDIEGIDRTVLPTVDLGAYALRDRIFMEGFENP